MKLYLLIILLSANIAYAEVTVDRENDHIFFGDRIEYYEDTNNLTFKEILIQNTPWHKSSLKSLNFGLTKSSYWIRFGIENKADTELHLTFNTVNLDSIKLYIIEKNGSYTEKTGGIIYPFNHREIYDKDTFFIIPKFTGTKTIYARLNSGYLMAFVPEILTENRILERFFKIYATNAVYYGILLALIIYNFIIYIFSKEKLYILSVLLFLSYGLYDIANDGIGFMFFWPDCTFFENIVIPLSVGLIEITSGYFLQVTLETKKRYKTVHWLIYSVIICGIAIFPLSFLLERSLIMVFIFIIIIYASLCIIFSLFYLGFIKRNRSGVLLFVGFFFMPFTIFLVTASSRSFFTDLMPFLNNYFGLFLILKFARAWVVIMFSSIIADKINVMKKNLEIGEETYRSIFNGTNEAISIYDTDNFRIIDTNNTSLKMFDMTVDEMIGKHITYFSSTEDGFDFDRVLKYYRAMLEGDYTPSEWIVKKPDGEKFWVEVTISIVMINGVQRLMVVVRDIEDRKKAEEEREKMLNQLTQVQKMEAVGSLSGGLAHDFNNFLTGILASSSLLEEQAEQNQLDREKVKKYTGIINRVAVKAADTVRRLLTLTRKQELKLTYADLNISLKNVIEICLNSFPKSVSMQIKYFDGPAFVNADVSGIEQVLLNILVNASHALTIMRNPDEKEGGIISVETGRVYADDEFCVSNPGLVKGVNYFSVSIHDNGCGIDEQIIDRIFDPFFSTKRKGEGTGLGLSMAYSIVRQHNGIIKVYSEKGEGATFILYLPEASGGNSLEPEEIDGVIKWHGRILVIDDEDFIREVVADILIKCGYDIYTAPGGEEGIEIFKKNMDRIDAVLLDTSMPGLTGLDTFKELKKIKPSVKIIMTSGFGMDERAQAAIKLGADSFIQKPYTKVQISRAMYELLKG